MEGYTRQTPPLLLNLNLMLAAVYDERRYAESLSILSDTLKFVQSVPKFEVEEMRYTVEIMTLSPCTLSGGQTFLRSFLPK
ncbi:Pvc16 family protein [uncultured Bacteroides sp.]|uniref:Pvc16 family protein n=1 Tax=uncultured Bacteroides sp. TaxID=162156 RepID=UPI0025F6B0E6|nr:Pvc16 family protein [uncultured Bacteroides sp.]